MPSLSPHLTIGGVDCTIHMDGGVGIISEAWPADGPTAEVVLKCDWGDRYALAQALMGSFSVVGGVPVSVPAFAWPESPNMFCQSIGSITPMGWETYSSGWGGGVWALVPAQFGILRYDQGVGGGGGTIQDPSGQPFTTTRFRLNGEVIQPPGGTFYYQGGALAGVPVDKSLVGIMAPKVEISMNRHRVPPPVQLSAIMALIGTVNESPLTFADHTFDVGCLLFGGFTGTESFDSLGNMTYEVEYGLLGQTHEWNELLAKDAEWHLINSVKDGSGREPFLYSDFSSIP